MTALSETNWAGNYTYRAGTVHRPATREQVQEIVASAPRVRVLGSRHSFTDVGDSAELLTLDDLPADVVVDHDARTVAFTAGLTYGALAESLAAEGLALGNTASLPHISVAGAVATATHGSGDANGNLATAVAAMEIITSSGEVVAAARGGADFAGLVVGLGALGAVTRITLDVEPAYQVRQRVFEGLGWDALSEHFDEITSSGYSVSVFTRWRDATDQVWVKSRVTEDPEQVRSELFGGVPPPSTGTPSWASTRSTARRSWACRVRGPSASRTSARVSFRATATRSSRSTSWHGRTLLRRPRRCGGWPTRFGRCCKRARSAPRPPTTCG